MGSTRPNSDPLFVGGGHASTLSRAIVFLYIQTRVFEARGYSVFVCPSYRLGKHILRQNKSEILVSISY